MQSIQITRGILKTRQNSKAGQLAAGELFLDYTNKDKTYELYAGVPDGTGTKAVKVAADGVLSYIERIDDGKLPDSPIEGGVYYIGKDIELDTENDQAGVALPEFKAGDLAIWAPKYAAVADTFTSGTTTSKAYAGWIRIKNSGATAADISFDNRNTNYQTTTTTVQKALVEADRNKLEYGGILFSKNTTDNPIMTVISDTSSTGNYIVTKDAVSAKVKPGFLYSIGELPTAFTGLELSDDSAGTTGVIALEEGDFVSVTSNETTNDAAPDTTKYVYSKISGGTHKSEKVKATAGTRNTNAGSFWKDEDAAISNVQSAINVIYESKADLTKSGKIPLAELPDTVIGSMDFQGTYTLASGSTFALPTSANKTSGTGTSDESEAKLVKGDYWIYSGSNVDLKTFTNVTSAEGSLRSSDWLVYEGTDSNGVEQWSVVDNTSPITGIFANGSELEGDVDFVGNKRTFNTTDVVEVSTEVADSKLKISAPNTALIPNATTTGKIYKEGGNKTLVDSGLSETDDTLKVVEKNGLSLSGGITGKETLAATIKQNTAQTEDITLTLPSATGTLARVEDISDTFIKGTHFYIPRFGIKTDAAGKSTQVLADSPIEVIEHDTTDGTTNVIGVRYHSGDITSDLVYTNTKNVTNIMPSFSGYMLNSNSIIDCGEWSDTGVTYPNEGKFSEVISDGTTTTDMTGTESDYAATLLTKAKTK